MQEDIIALTERYARREPELTARAAVNPLRCAVDAPRKPWVTVHRHPSNACVRPMDAAGKTCDACAVLHRCKPGFTIHGEPARCMRRARVFHAPGHKLGFRLAPDAHRRCPMARFLSDCASLSEALQHIRNGHGVDLLISDYHLSDTETGTQVGRIVGTR